MNAYIMTVLIIVISKISKILFDIGTKFVLGDFEYGKFVVLLSKEVIISTFIVFGINNFIIKKIPSVKEKEGQDDYIYNSLYIMLLLYIIVIIVGRFIFTDDTFEIITWIVLVTCALLEAIIKVLTAVFKINSRVKEGVFIGESIPYLTFFILIILITSIKRTNAKDSMFVISIAFFVVIIIMWILLKKRNICFVKSSNFKINFNKCKEVAMYSFPVLINGFTYILLQKIDIIMLEYYGINYTEIGNYNVVVKIASQLIFFVQVAITMFIPVLSRKIANNNSYAQIKSFNEKNVSIAFFMTAICVSSLFILNNYFDIFNILRINNQSDITVLILFSISKLIYSFLFVFGYILYFNNHVKIQYFNNIVILTVGILLNIVGINYFGVLGAAAATVISVLLGNILEMTEVFVFLKKPFINIKTFLLFVCITIVISLFIIKINSFGVYPLIIVTFLLIIYCVKLLKRR